MDFTHPPLLKHPNNTDVAIQVLKKFVVPGKDRVKLRVQWWNIGRCHEPWPMGIQQNLKLTRSQFANWKPYQWVKESPLVWCEAVL